MIVERESQSFRETVKGNVGRIIFDMGDLLDLLGLEHLGSSLKRHRINSMLLNPGRTSSQLSPQEAAINQFEAYNQNLQRLQAEMSLDDKNQTQSSENL